MIRKTVEILNGRRWHFLKMESFAIQARREDDSEHTVTIEKIAFVKDFLNIANTLIPNQRVKYVEIWIVSKRSFLAFSEKN
jgi:hypothetical protein